MKKILTILTLIGLACISGVQKQQQSETEQNLTLEQMKMEKSFYDFKMKDIDGKEVDFNQYKGKKVLLVNVASKCGFHPPICGTSGTQ